MIEWADSFQYSPAIVVPAGALVFVSGQVGLDPVRGIVADPEAQFVKAFENLDAVLRAAGSSLDRIVELTTYHTSMEHTELFRQVKERFIHTPPFPAWSIIGASALGHPGLLVEIKAVATMP
jgi:enamine deaminase RidA (YjgF/YER057c/UK114 family)